LKESNVAQDQAGRPVVVVTGYGVVTSLGAGKDDNWRKLTAGDSGIRAISRFSTEGLKTRIAGTVDFVSVEPAVNAPELSQRLAELAAEEAVAQSGIGARGDFPGPMFMAVAPVEIEWQQRHEIAAASGANDAVTYNDLTRMGETGRFQNYYERFLFGSVADRIAEKFGTKGSPISLSTACAPVSPRSALARTAR
jgi:3-oxoacyl-[acyl-carrier-protein] synthase II